MPKLAAPLDEKRALPTKPGNYSGRLPGDALTYGLELIVTPASRTWFFRYRAHGKSLRFRLGAVSDDQGLTWARQRVRGYRERGEDPQAAKRRSEAEERLAQVRTIDDLAKRYIEARAGVKADSTVAGEQWMLDRYVIPAFGPIGIFDVARADVRALLKKATKESGKITSNRVHSLVRGMFNYAIGTLDIEKLVNPAARLTGARHDEGNRAEIVFTDEELRTLWAVLNDPPAGVDLSKPVALAIKLVAVTLQRPAEIAGMHSKELDLEAGVWTIPGKRMKARRVHKVPLSPLAVEFIKDALNLADWNGANAGPVFPTPRGHGPRVRKPRDKVEPIKRAALSRIMSRLRHALKDDAGGSPFDNRHVHDLRGTGRTALTSERLGISRDTAERVIGHIIEKGSGKAYDGNEYLGEKRKALEAWADLLSEIVSGKQRAANVVSIGGRTP